jgi:NDP-sugar pyrophosphorylase family protein
MREYKSLRNVTALIMAGGRSERMRASLGPRHKSLVPILGTPMIERNIIRLLSEGIRDVIVSYSAQEPELEDYLQTTCRALVEGSKARFEMIREERPLGNIGVAGQLRDRCRTILIVYVDNLTTLPLRHLIHSHRWSQAAFTAAVHREQFRMPYGEVRVRNGHVVRYIEKPTYHVLIASGVYVVSPEACSLISDGCPMSVAELYALLRKKRRPVNAFLHDAPWIDVNDADTVRKAEQLIFVKSSEFELCRISPNRQVVGAILYTGSHVLAQEIEGSRRYCEMPVVTLDDSKALWGALLKLKNQFTIIPDESAFSCSMDVFHPDVSELVRYHVFFFPVQEHTPPETLKWIQRTEDQDEALSSALRRSIAMLRHQSA